MEASKTIITQADQTRLLQAKVSDTAFRLIKAEAGRRLRTIGDVVTELATENLPKTTSPEENDTALEGAGR